MQLPRIALSIVSTAAVCSVAACGDDPVRYSEPVGIQLKAKSSDVVAGALDDEKGINTESGNPYGAFIAGARASLGGSDPAEIALEGLTVTLGGGSTGVTGVGQVFTGQVDVLFVMNDTNNSFPAGGGVVAATDGTGPIGLDATFDSSALATADMSKLLGGSFKVVIRGPAAATFEAAGADADLQLTLTFAAYE
jgi:hypothetical protein